MRLKSGKIIKNQNGLVLITVIVVCMMISLLVMGLLVMISSQTRLLTREINSTFAFYLAEAGINRAVYLVKISSIDLPRIIDQTVSVSYNLEGHNISLSFTLTALSSYNVVSEASLKEVKRTIEAKIEKDAYGIVRVSEWKG